MARQTILLFLLRSILLFLTFLPLHDRFFFNDFIKFCEKYLGLNEDCGESVGHFFLSVGVVCVLL
jgi:hypothetical protein